MGMQPNLEQRPRVLIVEQGEGLWGAQRYLLRLAPLLSERGFHQLLAAPLHSATAVAWQKAGGETGGEVVDFPVAHQREIRKRSTNRISPPLVARELGRTARNAWKLAAIARAQNIDVIHANSHWSHLEAALAGRLARRAVVLHLHEETLPGIAGRLRALSVRLATATIAVSGAVASCLPPKTQARVTVIRNGVDAQVLTPGPANPAIRAEMATDPTAPVVLVMCRLDPKKGVDHVIRAVAQLPEHLVTTQLAIAGTGSLDPTWATHLHQLGAELLGNRVRFLGPREDIAELLRAADVFALASSHEGLPLGVLEAQACGTPVVAYPAAGVPEVVEDGVTGLLAKQDDTRHLTTQLTRLLEDSQLREQLATAARAQLLELFTLKIQADHQAKLLRSITGGSR